MKKLNRIERLILAKVFINLCECGLFVGKYDAEHGDEHFMYGVNTVMESLAYMISDKVGDTFNEAFLRNMEKSEKKVLDKNCK